MSEQTTVLGALRSQLHALQVRPPGMMTPHIAVGTSETKQMLRAHIANTLVLRKGTVLAVVKGDQATKSQVKGWGLNLAALPREIICQLQDGVTAELHTKKGRALQVLSEQKVNLEQLSLQCNNLVVQT